MKLFVKNLLDEVRFLIILLSMMITVFAVALSVVGFSYYKLSELRSQATVTADELESLLEVPLYSVDDESAVRIARAFLLSGRIAGIELSSTATGMLLNDQSAQASKQIEAISREVSGRGMALGSFTITFSDAEIRSSQKMLFLLCLVIIFSVLLANIFASNFIAKRVRIPFMKIFSGIKHLAKGDYATQIEQSQYNDVNLLIHHFNEMAGKIYVKSEERQKAEETLRNERQFLINVIDFLPDATFIIDNNGTVVAWNRAATEMTGVQREDIIGKGDLAYAIPFFGKRQPILIDMLDYPADEVEHFYKYIRRSGKAIFAESFIQHLNEGKGAHLWGVAAPIFDHKGNRTGAIEMIRDVTEVKQAEDEKAKLKEQLLQNQKIESVGRLAGGIAHDFNNMLTVILGHTQLAQLDIANSESCEGHLEKIEETTNRSGDLVKQLLAFARKQTVSPCLVNINEAIDQTLQMLNRLIGEDIAIHWRPKKDSWSVWIDPTQIDQLLINLCVNSRDAIKGVGKIELETANIVVDDDYCRANPESNPGEYLMLAISDDGCGMDDETIAHIFEPFYTTKGMGEGTGMGLATVYGIVKQNGGFINVYSELEKGTTFRVYLPRSTSDIEESSPVEMKEEISGQGETILVVEDDTFILEMFKEMLEKLGYRVLPAESPNRAMEIFNEHSPEIHLLITDVVMPEMNGRELAQRLKEERVGLKCLFSSGYTSDVIAHHGVLDPDVCFLQKPFSFHDLGVKVRQALSQEASQV